MAVTQYIGARYVPLFATPIEWSKTREYEPLTIVTYQGNSYTSRQAVPRNVEIDNEDYWVLTANYNAQIEQYRQEVARVSAGIDNVTDDVLDLSAQVENISDTKLPGIEGDIDTLEGAVTTIGSDVDAVELAIGMPYTASTNISERLLSLENSRSSTSKRLVTDKMLVLGHGGLKGAAPFGSLVGYKLAMKYGYDGCEIDTRKTTDGMLVAHHNDSLSGWTDATAGVNISTSVYSDLTGYVYDKGVNVSIFSSEHLAKVEDCLKLLVDNQKIAMFDMKMDSYNGYFDVDYMKNLIDDVFSLVEKYNYINKTFMLFNPAVGESPALECVNSVMSYARSKSDAIYLILFATPSQAVVNACLANDIDCVWLNTSRNTETNRNNVLNAGLDLTISADTTNNFNMYTSKVTVVDDVFMFKYFNTINGTEITSSNINDYISEISNDGTYIMPNATYYEGFPVTSEWEKRHMANSPLSFGSPMGWGNPSSNALWKMDDFNNFIPNFTANNNQTNYVQTKPIKVKIGTIFEIIENPYWQYSIQAFPTTFAGTSTAENGWIRGSDNNGIDYGLFVVGINSLNDLNRGEMWVSIIAAPKGTDGNQDYNNGYTNFAANEYLAEEASKYVKMYDAISPFNYQTGWINDGSIIGARYQGNLETVKQYQLASPVIPYSRPTDSTYAFIGLDLSLMEAGQILSNVTPKIICYKDNYRLTTGSNIILPLTTHAANYDAASKQFTMPAYDELGFSEPYNGIKLIFESTNKWTMYKHGKLFTVVIDNWNWILPFKKGIWDM